MPSQRFPYVLRHPGLPRTSLMPYAPAELMQGPLTVQAMALLDTGAMMNVLPFSLGTALGLDWNQYSIRIPLTGNLSGIDSRVVTVDCKIGQLPKVKLTFAWTSSDLPPLIFGQIDFFLEFDVAFSRFKEEFDVSTRPPTP